MDCRLTDFNNCARWPEFLKKDSNFPARGLSKHKSALPTDLKQKLNPYHSEPPNPYDLPKVHKPNIPLRPTVSSIRSPCYALAGYLHTILSPQSSLYTNWTIVAHKLQVNENDG
jgi:hypothetical protein